MKNCSVVYVPNGKAREYASLAVNLYTGCSHGCVVCWVPLMTHKTRESFYYNPTPRERILENLERDAQLLEDEGRDDYILMCFTCDPYQPVAAQTGVTREAIKILMRHNLKFNILTKGGMRSIVDFDLLEEYTDRCKYGTTMVFTDDDMRRKFEPFASRCVERVMALAYAHERGIPTWVSLEPVIDPEQAKLVIMHTHGVVDEYKIGKVNYAREISDKIDWKKFAVEVSELCDTLGVNYYLKNSLRSELEMI